MSTKTGCDVNNKADQMFSRSRFPSQWHIKTCNIHNFKKNRCDEVQGEAEIPAVKRSSGQASVGTQLCADRQQLMSALWPLAYWDSHEPQQPYDGLCPLHVVCWRWARSVYEHYAATHKSLKAVFFYKFFSPFCLSIRSALLINGPPSQINSMHLAC